MRQILRDVDVRFLTHNCADCKEIENISPVQISRVLGVGPPGIPPVPGEIRYSGRLGTTQHSFTGLETTNLSFWRAATRLMKVFPQPIRAEIYRSGSIMCIKHHATRT
jgi:hypothetical protein